MYVNLLLPWASCPIQSLFVDPYNVSWLLETHPEDAPAHIMAEVSDPFQPFDPQTSANDMSDFIAELPEWYVDDAIIVIYLYIPTYVRS